jgi:fatty-acyl-CoA synthase
MRTGDLGTIDAQGYCNIVGRIKDMVIWGGENIYPREIEEFLHGHPAVADVHVFGVPSKRYGEELCAWIKLRSGFEGMGRAELRAWCQGQIARYKVPRYWKFVESFPMTASGKPQKYKMREAAIAELGLGGK